MTSNIRLAIILACFSAVVPLAAADWPAWRGPNGTGSTTETSLPVKWSATENVAWKAEIGGLGVSTPIVSGRYVFVSSQLGSSTRRAGTHPRLVQGGDPTAAGERALGESQAGREQRTDGKTFFLLEAFDRADGKRAWEYRMEAAGPMPEVHDKHNMASPSPVSDGQMVYAWFATGQIVALDMKGQRVWERHLGREIAPFDLVWGHSSSPVVFEDTLLLLCMHGAKHCWSRLAWICDLAELIGSRSNMDWDALVDRAAACGAERMLYLGLNLASDFLGAQLPLKIHARASQPSVGWLPQRLQMKRTPIARRPTKLQVLPQLTVPFHCFVGSQNVCPPL